MGLIVPVRRRAKPQPSYNYDREQLRRKLEREYGRRIVKQSLTVWNALPEDVEKDKMIADIVVGAKALLETSKILKSMIEDDSSERAKKQAKKTFEELSMDNTKPMKECIIQAKYLALNVQYHDIEVTEQEFNRRVLNGLPPAYAPEKRNFALKTDFSLSDLEDRNLDGTDGRHALVAGFKTRSGGQSARSEGRGGHNGGGRAKRGGKGRPPN